MKEPCIQLPHYGELLCKWRPQQQRRDGIFEWFAKQFGDFTSAYDIESCMNSLLRETAKVPAGSNGLLFYPTYWASGHHVEPDARGMYFGINIKHEQQHFIRATVEGILYEIFSIR